MKSFLDESRIVLTYTGQALAKGDIRLPQGLGIILLGHYPQHTDMVPQCTLAVHRPRAFCGGIIIVQTTTNTYLIHRSYYYSAVKIQAGGKTGEDLAGTFCSSRENIFFAKKKKKNKNF